MLACGGDGGEGRQAGTGGRGGGAFAGQPPQHGNHYKRPPLPLSFFPSRQPPPFLRLPPPLPLFPLPPTPHTQPTRTHLQNVVDRLLGVLAHQRREVGGLQRPPPLGIHAVALRVEHLEASRRGRGQGVSSRRTCKRCLVAGEQRVCGGEGRGWWGAGVGGAAFCGARLMDESGHSPFQRTRPNTNTHRHTHTHTSTHLVVFEQLLADVVKVGLHLRYSEAVQYGRYICGTRGRRTRSTQEGEGCAGGG